MSLVAASTLSVIVAFLGSGPAASDVVVGSDPASPLPIIDGGPVPDCAWPTAVSIYSGSLARCSGVYVGGRVVLTAAHCIPGGFIIGGQLCSADDECPDVSSLNGEINLECDTEMLECRDPDSLLSNAVTHVQFGSAYEDETALDGNLPRKSIQVSYCKKKSNVPLSPQFPSAEDLAYCLLTEEPNLQAIPIAAACEIDAELDVGTEIVAIGFGNFVAGDSDSGVVKRWATSVLGDDWLSTSAAFFVDGLGWTSEGGVSVSLTSGDSGGPLFAHMSDGTWRVVGIARTPGSWVNPFKYIGWLDTDVNFDIADVLPCHDVAGSFTGGPGCGMTPVSPSMASGQWERGSHACHTESVLQITNLCLAAVATGQESLQLKTAPLGSRADDESRSSPSGCRIGGPVWVRMGMGPIILLLMRRRRS